MIDFLSNFYLWLKVFHIISFVAWMAGLFYLPRLFVYHTMTLPESETSRYFLIMERKLLKIIMLPAMLSTFFFGGCLLLVPGLVDWSQGWIYGKIFLALLLAFMHGLMVRWYKQLAFGKRYHSVVFFRLVNEIPTVIMVFIIILVVVKPF